MYLNFVKCFYVSLCRHTLCLYFCLSVFLSVCFTKQAEYFHQWYCTHKSHTVTVFCHYSNWCWVMWCDIIDQHRLHEVTSDCRMFVVTLKFAGVNFFSVSSCSYLEKFTDFLRLFVSVHLRRIESSPQFPIVEFLALLFKYTFNQVICLVICLCNTLRDVNFYRSPANMPLIDISAHPWRLLCLFGYLECLFGFSNNQNQKQTSGPRQCPE